MSATLPPVPLPPPPEVARFDAQGRATVAQRTYEAKRLAFDKAVKAALEGS